MTRIALIALILGSALTAPAAAHMIWLEREGATVQLFFGEPADNVRERTGATLDRIASPRLIGATVNPQRQPDHVAFSPVGAGDARAIEEGLAPREDKQRGGRTRTVFLAREGRSETSGGLDLELVPVSTGGEVFTLLFRGKALPRASLELIGPPGWTKGLRTDEDGRVVLSLPWAGRYVAEVVHVDEQPGGTADRAYNRTRYVSTLSFSVAQGIPWTASR